MTNLADRLIKQGPFTAGDVLPLPLAPNGHMIITAKELNELRDELIAHRTYALETLNKIITAIEAKRA